MSNSNSEAFIKTRRRASTFLNPENIKFEDLDIPHIVQEYQSDISKRIFRGAMVSRILHYLFALIMLYNTVNDVLLMIRLEDLAFKLVLAGFIADQLNGLYFSAQALRIFKSKQIAPSLAFARTFNIYLGMSHQYYIFIA